MAVDPDGPDVFEARPKADRSITTLLSDLASETILLIRQEMALFKAELSEKFSRIGQGAGALGAGALIAFSGWLVLLAAAVLGLAAVLLMYSFAADQERFAEAKNDCERGCIQDSGGFPQCREVCADHPDHYP